MLMFSNEGLLSGTLPVSDDRELIFRLSVRSNIDQPAERSVSCRHGPSSHNIPREAQPAGNPPLTLHQHHPNNPSPCPRTHTHACIHTCKPSNESRQTRTHRCLSLSSRSGIAHLINTHTPHTPRGQMAF